MRTPVTSVSYTDLYLLEDVNNNAIQDVNGNDIYYIGPSIPFNPQRN